MSTYEEIRDQRRRAGLCVMCGNPNDSKNSARCVSCRAKRNKYVKNTYSSLRAMDFTKPEAQKRAPTMSIEEVNKLALEKHISYGQMVAILDGFGRL